MSKRKPPGKPMIERFTSVNNMRFKAKAVCNGVQVGITIDDENDVISVGIQRPGDVQESFSFYGSNEIDTLLAVVEEVVKAVTAAQEGR